jgi:hypothetical protein
MGQPHVERLMPSGEADQRRSKRIHENVDDDNSRLEECFGPRVAIFMIAKAGGERGFVVKTCGCVR